MSNEHRTDSAVRSGAAQLVRDAVGTTRAPTVVTFQVTDRCQYDCPHCYQTHGRASELTTEEIDRTLRDLANAGVLFVTLMGGEFFMRRDADEVLRSARRHRFAIKLLTTGHHIDDRRADLIRDLGAIEVHLSVYSANHRVHDALTLVAGSWARTIAAARRLRARGVPVALKSPVMNANAYGLSDIVDLASSLGASCELDPKVTTRRDGDSAPAQLRAGDDALRAFYGDRRVAFLGDTGPDSIPAAAPLSATPCYAGQAVAAIDPQGNITPCVQLPIVCGNVRDHLFSDIWRNSTPLRRVRGLAWDRIAACRDCALRRYCSRCHALALREDGAIDGPSLEACRHAVLVRDELRARGAIDETETALPPTWDRVVAAEQERTRRAIRVDALRVLPS